jgi:hypothetical protein
VTGLNARVLPARKAAGLIAILVEKESVSPVAEKRVRSELSIHLADPQRQLANQKVRETSGAKKQLRGKNNETINGKL